ncbi:MAG TPA: trypsin-like serine protease [Acidobacteria bacterium]|nr:trypsin-like serine protease [Acidobacteriota bacterium]HIN70272.1 trypsin-like serine protease [Acidobacteriota bacterium]
MGPAARLSYAERSQYLVGGTTPNRRGAFMKHTLLACLLFVSGVVAGLVLTGRLQVTEESSARPAPEAVQPSTTAVPTVNLPNFSDVAAARIPSVINISSQTIERRSTSPFFNDPFFNYFFGNEPNLFGQQQRTSLGSGVIVSTDGYILTNNHVVGSADAKVTVTLSDDRELPATVVGVDQWTDIALLKIEANGLPVAPWGDSSTIRVAEWVLAIGNPFQLDQTVTLGIISAVRRANLGITTYEDFIQTDAAINEGNSGGALINGRGELIGINTAIFTQSGGDQGVGFAVPSNLARRVMDDLITYGEVQRGSIGYIELARLTTRQAEQLGMSDNRGALVSRMRRDTPAYDAGIRPGDVIVAFNGELVDDAAHLLRLLADAPIGETIVLTGSREGREVMFEVEIGRARSSR